MKQKIKAWRVKLKRKLDIERDGERCTNRVGAIGEPERAQMRELR